MAISVSNPLTDDERAQIDRAMPILGKNPPGIDLGEVFDRFAAAIEAALASTPGGSAAVVFDGTLKVLTAYSTVGAALLAANAGDTVFLRGETHTVSNPVTVAAGVSVVGDSAENTVLDCANPGSTGVICAGSGITLRNFTIKGASSPGSVGLHIQAAVTQDFSAENIHFEDCDTCVDVEGAAETLKIINPTLVASAGPITTFVRVRSGGHASVQSPFLDQGVTVTNGLLVDGAGTIAHVIGGHLESNAGASANGVHVTNGGQARCTGLHTHGFQHGARIGATDGVLYLLACDLTASTVWEVLTEGGSASKLFVAATTAPINMVSISAGTNRYGSFLSDEIGDEGTAFVGQVAIGLANAGRELAAGQGDSYTAGMHVFTNTNGEAGTWADHTTAARSGGDSTFPGLPGTTAENCLYVCQESRIYWGLKTAQTVAIDLGAGALALEYWNGAAWIALPYMATNADNPYRAKAQTAWARTTNDQLRWAAPDDWAAKVLNGQSGYWIRFRVTTGITTAPTIEQIKISPSRTEINADGFPEHFGDAISEHAIGLPPPRSLVGGGAPLSTNIDVSASITFSGTNNVFRTGDGIAFVVPAPEGLDTSRDLTFELLWRGSSADAASNITLRLVVVEVRNGDLINGALPEAVYDEVLTDPVALDVAVSTQIKFKTPNVVPGDNIVLSLQRLAAGDTYVGNIEALEYGLVGALWH